MPLFRFLTVIRLVEVSARAGVMGRAGAWGLVEVLELPSACVRVEGPESAWRASAAVRLVYRQQAVPGVGRERVMPFHPSCRQERIEGR